MILSFLDSFDGKENNCILTEPFNDRTISLQSLPHHRENEQSPSPFWICKATNLAMWYLPAEKEAGGDNVF
jgi:hypothetical protein